MKTLLRLLSIVLVMYLLDRFYPAQFSLLFYPVMILVTFFHELGHALFAVLSGGDVHNMVINMDGSGMTTTSGGSESLTIIGGYLGSAIFGNLMVYAGAKGNSTSNIFAFIMIFIFMIATLFWISSIFALFWAIGYTICFYVLSKWKFLLSYVLMCIGLLSTIHILQDFRVGPSSDLEAYEQTVGIFPASIWMYIWLILVVCLTCFNGYLIVKSEKVVKTT